MSASKKKGIGILAVMAGFLGLLAVLAGPQIRDGVFPKPSVEERIAEKVVAIRDAITARLKGESAPRFSSRFSGEQLPYTISLALAAAAIIGGCVSYLRREDRRFAYVACGVGALTLVWHAMLLAVGALILCALLFVVFSLFAASGG